jgi:transposase
MLRTKVNESSFTCESIYIGIDCHLKSWKVTILTEEIEHATLSMEPDAEKLFNYLNKHFPGAEFKAVYESGFNGFALCRELLELGVKCIVVNASDVPTSHRDRQQKSDKSDSRKLAKMLRSKQVEGIHIPDKELEADRSLVRQRYKTMRKIRGIKVQLKSFLYCSGISLPKEITSRQSRSWSKTYISWLQNIEGVEPSTQQVITNYLTLGLSLIEELKIITMQVKVLGEKERYQTKVELLRRIPGIGELSAIHLITQLGEINRFRTLDHLCSYVGLVPKMYGSGDRIVTGNLSGRGRKEIKEILIECSWVAIRKDPAMMVRYNNLKKRMTGNKAIIRIAKNILSRIRYVLITGEEYELGIVK